jgi:glycosyltransferase involved in cell wall biosynthesis
MKIGFDISQTGKLKAGCGFVADSLIRALAEIDQENQYILYPTFGDTYWDPNWSTDTCRITGPNFKCAQGSRTFEASKFLWNSCPAADFTAKLGNPDLIHSNNFFCPTWLRGCRLVYTLYDLSFLIHPEWTTEENRSGCFTGAFNASLYADWIISISHCSRKHFLQVFPHYPENRITVIHPASRFAGRREIPRPKNLPSFLKPPFWLNVGVLEPRKNQKGLIRAYALLKANLGGTLPLVIAGGKGWLMEDFEKELASRGLQQDVFLLGYVDNEALQWLYQNCFAFIYPSLFEGFGLPVLEAMTFGAPIIASGVSSLPEIVGQAGILVDPFNTEEIFQAMRRLAVQEESRQELKEKARKQAGEFSWRSAASKALEIYREVICRGPSSPHPPRAKNS